MLIHSKTCTLLTQYSDILKWCWVKLDNIKSTPNLTESTENVVYDKNKIINTKNPYYYILYTLKSKRRKTASVSSGENFVHSKKKYKRQRLLSQSSNETTIIDRQCKGENNKSSNTSNLTTTSDIECVVLDDSDSSSTFSSNTTKYTNIDLNPERKVTIEKTINNIMSICYKKYVKRYNIDEKHTKNGNDTSFLQRKVLSIGRKTIHKEGFNSTGLLRYMEHKDLDVVWIPKLEANVTVKTTLKECKRDEITTYKNLTDIDKSYKPKDFIDIFEEVTTSEADSTDSNLIFDNDNTVQQEPTNKEHILSDSNMCSSNYVNDNSILDSEKSTVACTTTENSFKTKMKSNVLCLVTAKKPVNTSNTKLLNTSPVPNPKTLIKKVVAQELTTAVITNTNNNNEILASNASNTDKSTKSSESQSLPIITSTLSLASLSPIIRNKEAESSSSRQDNSTSKAPQSSMPRIKVKPYSELMAHVPERPKGFSVPTSVWAGNSKEQQSPNILSNLLYSPAPVYIGLMQPNSANAVNRPEHLTSQVTSNSVDIEPQGRGTAEYLTLHTVELPRTRTRSPFQYFKDLLHIYNLDLVETSEPASCLSCIIKFKLHYEQCGKEPVTLCLALFYYKNTFFIQIKDLESRLLNMNDFSAFWQWEVLKGFKGDVLSLMLQNAKKCYLEMFQQTQKFVTLLNNILVIR